MKTKLLTFSFTLVLSSLLISCSSVITTFSDKPVSEKQTSRSFGEKFDDGVLTSKAKINIAANTKLKDSHIEIYSYESELILIGQVETKQLIKEAENTVQNLRDVRGLKNFLVVGPNTSIGRNLKDSLISTSIKTKLLLNNEQYLGNVKAVVENAEVYLYGLATIEQADLATALARETSGVKTVIKAFSYVN